MGKSRSITLNPINVCSEYVVETKGAKTEALRGSFQSSAQDHMRLKGNTCKNNIRSCKGAPVLDEVVS